MSTLIARAPLRPLPQTGQGGLGISHGLWLFVVGASVAVDVPIMGRVMGPDILSSIGLLVLLLGRGVRGFSKQAKLFFLMVGLWLFGAVITDLIRGTAVEDIVRGWSKIGFFGITFAYLFLGSRGKLSLLLSFFLGLSAGALITLLSSPDEFFLVEPWKFGYGTPITVFLMACISTPFFRRLLGWWGPIAVTVLIAVINLVENSRSVFAILLAVASIVTLGEIFRKLLRGNPVPRMLFILSLLGGVVFYQGIVTIYGTAASSGILGEDAREKYEAQTQSGMGVLLGGRAESLVSIQAIADSPIIGHGSWATDYGYVMLYIEALEKRGVPIIGDPYSSGLIPSHSFLFGSWVEAGILGGLFWIYILAICGRSLYSLLHIPAWSRPIVAFLVLTLVWDVLFSPFGAQQRFFVPAEFCIVLWAIRNEQSKIPLQQGKAGVTT